MIVLDLTRLSKQLANAGENGWTEKQLESTLESTITDFKVALANASFHSNDLRYDLCMRYIASGMVEASRQGCLSKVLSQKKLLNPLFDHILNDELCPSVIVFLLVTVSTFPNGIPMPIRESLLTKIVEYSLATGMPEENVQSCCEIIAQFCTSGSGKSIRWANFMRDCISDLSKCSSFVLCSQLPSSNVIKCAPDISEDQKCSKPNTIPFPDNLEELDVEELVNRMSVVNKIIKCLLLDVQITETVILNAESVNNLLITALVEPASKTLHPKTKNIYYKAILSTCTILCDYVTLTPQVLSAIGRLFTANHAQTWAWCVLDCMAEIVRISPLGFGLNLDRVCQLIVPEIKRFDEIDVEKCASLCNFVENLVQYNGPYLNAGVYTDLQRSICESCVWICNSPLPVLNPGCRLSIYSALQVLLLNPNPKVPLPVHIASVVFSKGSKDPDMKVAELCCRAMRLVSGISRPMVAPWSSLQPTPTSNQVVPLPRNKESTINIASPQQKQEEEVVVMQNETSPVNETVKQNTVKETPLQIRHKKESSVEVLSDHDISEIMQQFHDSD